MSSTNLLTPSNVGEAQRTFGNQEQNHASVVLRLRRFFPTSVICASTITLFTSTTESRASVVCKLLISDQELANSCCSFMQMMPSYLFQWSAWTWSNVTRAPKDTNRNSIASAAWVGKKRKP